MGKILGAVFILAGIGCAFAFVSVAFMHGFQSGMRRLGDSPEHFLFGGGALVCLVVGVVALVRKPAAR
jgi:hypothetical protein